MCFQCGADLQVVPAQTVMEGDATGGVIPYKNPKALIAYYLGILSGLPIIGLPLGIAAFILGLPGTEGPPREPGDQGQRPRRHRDRLRLRVLVAVDGRDHRDRHRHFVRTVNDGN